MKNLILILAAIFAISTTSTAQIAFKSGNAEMDANLNTMNADAKLDLGKFKANLSLSYGVPKTKVDQVFSLKVEPAEAFMIFEIGNITNKPIDDVVASYKKNKGKGWGVIAKELGIKPGSPEFHALKGKSKGNKGNGGGKDKKDKKDKEEKGGKGNGKGNGKGKGKK